MSRLIGTSLLLIVLTSSSPLFSQVILGNVQTGTVTVEDIAFDPSTKRVFVPDVIGNGLCLVFESTLDPAPSQAFNMPFLGGDEVRGIAVTPAGLLVWVVTQGSTASVFQTDDSGVFVPATQSPTQPLSQLTIPAGSTVHGIDLDDSGFLLFVQLENFVVKTPFAALPSLANMSFCGNAQPGTGVTWLSGPSFLQTGLLQSSLFDALRRVDATCTNDLTFQLPGVVLGFGVDFGFDEHAGSTIYVHDRNSGELTLFQLPQTNFVRGDFDGDQMVTGSDFSRMNGFLSGAGLPPGCMDAADVDDNGVVNLADAASLSLILTGGSAAPPPGAVCGVDPTLDTLGCRTSSCP